MTLAYIAIGSNLASPLEQVNAAVQALGEIPQSRIVAISSFYRTPPLGPQDQPDYLNAAVVLDTALDAETLLDNTQRIELQQGRVRKAERWGPRTLDLDIMLFGNEVINTSRLTVPHYDMKNRGFMLWPLFEVAPDLTFPDGIPLREIPTTSTQKNPLAGKPVPPRISHKIIVANRRPKIIVPSNVTVRMRKDSLWVIRKQYETNHHLLTAEMQTGKETLRHHHRI